MWLAKETLAPPKHQESLWLKEDNKYVGGGRVHLGFLAQKSILYINSLWS